MLAIILDTENCYELQLKPKLRYLHKRHFSQFRFNPRFNIQLTSRFGYIEIKVSIPMTNSWLARYECLVEKYGKITLMVLI